MREQAKQHALLSTLQTRSGALVPRQGSECLTASCRRLRPGIVDAAILFPALLARVPSVSQTLFIHILHPTHKN
jgi:hypothetical protein